MTNLFVYPEPSTSILSGKGFSGVASSLASMGNDEVTHQVEVATDSEIMPNYPGI